MKKLLLFAFTFSPILCAETFKTKIYSIDDNLVKFENGRVAFLDSMKTSVRQGDYVEVKLNERSSLTSLKKLKDISDYMLKIQSFRELTTPPIYEPTIVPSMNEALDIFNRSNPYFKVTSECSDRAHVWAHDEFKATGTKSLKAFIFFTASYINSMRFKWWFHVAPMYKVYDNGEVKDLVMDYSFSDRPLTVKEWSDLFIYTKRPCKITTKFSEYDVNPQAENCYMIFESMHYRLPGQIHDQEIKGIYKTTTSEAEVNMSRGWAFQNRRGVNL